MEPQSIMTRMLHAPVAKPAQEPTLPPIYQTVGFRFRDYDHAEGVFTGRIPGLVGARAGNPSATTLEAKLKLLEGAEAAMVVPSGMAAVAIGFLAFARAGDSVVVDHMRYVGTHGFVTEVLPRFGIEARSVDTTDLSQVERAMDGTTRAIFVESPGSWQLKVPDIAALADLARKRGARLVVDGTLATGYLQKPLALGADLAIYSASAYLNGHGDTVLGFVAGPAETVERLRSNFRNETGFTVASMDAWLVNRALATLGLRLGHQCATSQALAERLEGAPGVRRVIYPGLPSHPQYEVAKRQLKAGGGMVLFEMEDPAAVARFIDAVRVCAFSVGIGGPITMVFCPGISFPGLSPAEMEQRGVSHRLLRICVGLEETEEIVADVEQALARARG